MKVILIGIDGFGINLIDYIKENLDGRIDFTVIVNSDILENYELEYKIS